MDQGFQTIVTYVRRYSNIWRLQLTLFRQI